MITVAFDRDDATRLPAESRDRPLLALTPAAFEAAVAAGCSPTRTTATFGDSDHARCAAAARLAIREFDHAAASHDLPDCLRVTGRQAAWYVANIATRLTRTVRTFPAEVRGADGQWRLAHGRSELIDTLLPRILDHGLAHRFPAVAPKWPALHGLAARMAARRLRSRGPGLFSTHKLKLGFGEALAEAGIPMAMLRPTSGRAEDWLDLFDVARGRGARIPVAPSRPRDPNLARCLSALDRIGHSFSRADQRTGWRLYRPYLQANAAAMLGLAEAGSVILAAADAAGTATYEANGWSSAALLDAGRRAGRPSLVFNHNCHALTGRPVADSVLATLFVQRKRTPSVDFDMHWTPGDDRLAEVTRPAGNQAAPRSLPCRLDYPQAAARRGGRFRILHAGNYQNWSDFFPFVSETADEFVAGIDALTRAAAGIEDLDLVIRVRPKKEVDADVVRRIAQADNVTVCTTDMDFLEQLAESDLLVSYFSTTVLQALQMGKPVLLWGSTRRFHQVPARTLPPTGLHRAAVYAVDDADALRGMLTALRDHHRDAPLTPEETAPYRLHESVPDLAGLAGHLAAQFERSPP